MENWVDKRYYSRGIWTGGWKSKEMKNLFVLLKEKNEKIKSAVCINLLNY